MKRLIIFSLLFAQSFYTIAQSYQEYYIQGVQKMDERKYNEAINKFTKAININSSFEEAYLKRGACFVILNDNKKAITDFSFVIKINPKNPFAHFNRGMVKKELNDYKNAIIDFSSAIALNSTLKFAYYNRALCKLGLDDIENACLDLSKAADLGVENASEIYLYTCK